MDSENQNKKAESIEFSYKMFFIAMIIGPIMMGAFYEYGRSTSLKERNTLRKTGYYYGHQHAELRYNNPKSPRP